MGPDYNSNHSLALLALGPLLSVKEIPEGDAMHLQCPQKGQRSQEWLASPPRTRQDYPSSLNDVKS